VEAEYLVTKNRESRAIGLSMGARNRASRTESLMSSRGSVRSAPGGLTPELEKEFPGLTAGRPMRNCDLLWITCGTDDTLIGDQPKSPRTGWLQDIHHADIADTGEHTGLDVAAESGGICHPLLFTEMAASSEHEVSKLCLRQPPGKNGIDSWGLFTLGQVLRPGKVCRSSNCAPPLPAKFWPRHQWL